MKEDLVMGELNVHGGDIYSYIEQTGRKPLDYSANINPLGLPIEVKKALASNVDSFCDYPDIKCRKLKKAVAQYEQVSEDNLIFGNGAADLIYRLCHALNPQRALLLAPSFMEYGQALSSVNCKIDYYYMNSQGDFKLKEEILDYISGKDVFFLCNPNNPTGMIIGNDLLYQIALKCKEENCVLVIDECFMDFVTDKEKYSFKKYLSEFDYVIILKAFTKIFAMPGLRLGYCLSRNTNILKEIELAGQSWSVSVPAQIAGTAALQDSEYLKKTLEIITKERLYLTDSLKGLGFTVFESFTNFILFQTEDDLYPKLYHEGILIRKCANFIGLDRSFYRIAVKDRMDNEKLIHAITTVRATSNNH